MTNNLILGLILAHQAQIQTAKFFFETKSESISH